MTHQMLFGDLFPRRPLGSRGSEEFRRAQKSSDLKHVSAADVLESDRTETYCSSRNSVWMWMVLDLQKLLEKPNKGRVSTGV